MARLVVFVLGLSVALLCWETAAGAEGDKDKNKGITIDKEKRTIIVPAKIAPRKIDDPRYKEIYPLEVVATYPFPEGKKAHETVVTFTVKPSEVHKALLDFGLKPGKPARTEADVPTGPEVKIYIEVGTGGGARRVPIEDTMVDRKTGLGMKKVKWLFTGSPMTKPNPEKDETVYAADLTGTLIAIFPVTDETVFQSSLLLKDEKYVKLETNKKDLPPEGTPVKLVIVAPKPR
jgi:hypothetical protein